MDTAQWPQGIGVVKPMEASMVERRTSRPQKDQALNCPRCNSTNTKFCYYNNYSLSQPRYICKTCRRYWTEGGSLRNVPVGGGSRKNKRSSSSSSSPASSKKLGDLTPPGLPHSAPQNPKIHEGQDLNLAYPPPTEEYNSNSLSKFVEVPFGTVKKRNHQISSPSSASTHLSAMEQSKTGIDSRGLNSFVSMPVSNSNTVYASGFPVHDFKSTLSFSLDGFETGYGNLQGVQESGARHLFPMEELKPSSTTDELDQNRGEGDSTGYWSGMLGGGHWC